MKNKSHLSLQSVIMKDNISFLFEKYLQIMGLDASRKLKLCNCTLITDKIIFLKSLTSELSFYAVA